MIVDLLKNLDEEAAEEAGEEGEGDEGEFDGDTDEFYDEEEYDENGEDYDENILKLRKLGFKESDVRSGQQHLLGAE